MTVASTPLSSTELVVAESSDTPSGRWPPLSSTELAGATEASTPLSSTEVTVWWRSGWLSPLAAAAKPAAPKTVRAETALTITRRRLDFAAVLLAVLMEVLRLLFMVEIPVSVSVPNAPCAGVWR